MAFILVNQDGDSYSCDVDIYYDPMNVPSGERRGQTPFALCRSAAALRPEANFEDDVRQACMAAITSYIENLPFNGEYTNMALIDSLQQVEGVKIAELKGASASTISGGEAAIDARAVPAAGYYRAGDITVNMIAYGTL